MPLHYQSIPGWFDYESLYHAVGMDAVDGDILVEVGSYFGRSVVYLAETLLERGVRAELFAVDVWTAFASPEYEYYGSRYVDQYHAFLDGIRRTGTSSIVTPVRSDSASAAAYFADDSLSFVFIDADHTYAGVMRDLEAWWPKVRAGGIMAGHDFGWQDVAAAVRDFFGGKASAVDRVPSCWWVDK